MTLDAETVMRRFAAQQGWTEATQLILLMRFVTELNRVELLETYLQQIVEEEEKQNV